MMIRVFNLNKSLITVSENFNVDDYLLNTAFSMVSVMNVTSNSVYLQTVFFFTSNGSLMCTDDIAQNISSRMKCQVRPCRTLPLQFAFVVNEEVVSVLRR